MTRNALPSGLIYDDSQVPPGLISQDLRWVVQTPTETVLVSGIQVNSGQIVKVTLTAARVVGAPLLPVAGQQLRILLIQSGAGNWAVTWNAVFKGITGGTSGANLTRACFPYEYDGTNWNLVGGQPAFTA